MNKPKKQTTGRQLTPLEKRIRKQYTRVKFKEARLVVGPAAFGGASLQNGGDTHQEFSIRTSPGNSKWYRDMLAIALARMVFAERLDALKDY